jgi:cytochrome b561
MKADVNSKYPVMFRLWHWLNAKVVGLLLLTVFLRKTFLSSKKMAATLGQKLGENGVQAQEETLKGAARAIRDSMWEWHYPLGFVLGGLLLVRIFFARESFPGFKTWKARVHSSFYVACAFMVVSGTTMYFSDKLGISEELVDEILEIHETALWYFVGYIVVHLAGLIRAELTSEPGVVSKMIHGNRGEDSK